MELKQLEFFIACAEVKSLSKASDILYTSQPNVSKVIRHLEDELGAQLFERTSKGLRLTQFGKSIYEYALNTVKNAEIISNMSKNEKRATFYISTYQSNVFSKLLVKLYKNNPDIIIEHRQGTVEEIINHVEKGISEIGFLYVSQKHITAFLNVIKRKKLVFTPLGKFKACLFAGPENPLFERDTVSIDELPNLKFVRSLSDFFSVDDGLEKVSLGVVNSDSLHNSVYTNSEHLSTNLLLETDLVDIGINFSYPGKNQYGIKDLYIQDEASALTLGYVTDEGHTLSNHAQQLVQYTQELIKP